MFRPADPGPAEATRGPGLPILALVVSAASIGIVLGAAAATGTLGYDYSCCYDVAARRVLAGGPIYDLSFTQPGPAGLFDYPPPFLALVLPFAAVLSPPAAAAAWTAAMVVAFLAGIALMPVRREVRWLTLLLGSLSWPVVYSLKLGQVGGLLVLLFAVAWRGLASDRAVGAAAAIGSAIKLQPAVLFAWAVARARWGVVLVGAVVELAIVVPVTLVAGLGQWRDLVVLLRNLSDAMGIPGNLAPGAVAFQLGVSFPVANAIQVATVATALGLLGWTAFRGTAEASFLVAIVVSQLVAPVAWAHYAIVLVLPVAWFLERRAWAAALVPLVVAWPITSITPPIVYPALYAIVLLALVRAGLRRPEPARLVLARA